MKHRAVVETERDWMRVPNLNLAVLAKEGEAGRANPISPAFVIVTNHR